MNLWQALLCWLLGCQMNFDPEGDEYVCGCGQAYGARSWGDDDE